MALAPEQYLRPEVIGGVARLDLKARFIVDGFLTGLHAAPQHGFSAEFSEHRKYAPGDDIRLIDWVVYAKTDRFHIKKFQAETNLQAHLLVDCSGSMDYASAGLVTKMDYSICLAAALGNLMLRQQDAVGLVTFDSAVRSVLPPRSRPSQLMTMLGCLAAVRPAGPTGLARALHETAGRVARRGLVIVLSDLLDDPPAVTRALAHLRHRGHDVIVIQVLDRSELEFDFRGAVRFEDPETHQHADADARAIRAGYMRELNRLLDEYRQACSRLRIDMVTVDNSMTFDKALLKCLSCRRR